MPQGAEPHGAANDRADGADAAQREHHGGVRRRADTFWGWLRKTARLWGFIAFIAAVLALFRSVILPFMLAGLVTYVLAPVLTWLARLSVGGRRLPRFVWLIAMYLVLFGLIAGFVTLFVPRVSQDLKRIVAEAPKLMQTVRQRWLPSVATWVNDNFGGQGPAPAQPKSTASDQDEQKLRIERLADGRFELDAKGVELEIVKRGEGRWLVRAPREERAGDRSQRIEGEIENYVGELLASSESRLKQLFSWGQRFIGGLLRTITTFILVLMISAFLLLDSRRIIGWFRSLVPKASHQDFDNVLQLIDRALGGAIRGQLLICLVNGMLTGVGLVLLGVKYAVLLALLAGVLSLIPIFGSIISSFPIVLVALVSGDSGGVDLLRGVTMLAWIIGIHLIEANLLNPKIIGTAARMHPVVVIFAVVAGERTYGAVGALLGVPLVSALQAMFVYIRDKVRDDAQSADAV